MELTNMTIEDVYNQIKSICHSVVGITYVNGEYLALCKESIINNGKHGFCCGNGSCDIKVFRAVMQLLIVADKYMDEEIDDMQTLLRLLDKYFTVTELLQSGATSREVCNEMLKQTGKYRKIDNC